MSLSGDRPLHLYADDGEEAAGAGPLFAIAEQERGVTGGTKAGGEDIVFAKAGGEELRAIGFGEIEANVFGRRLVARRHHVEPLERIGFFAGAGLVEEIGGVGELRGELNDEFGADFVAAGADGWADRGEEIRGVRIEFGDEFADGLFEDAGEGTAPACVGGGDGAFFWIDQEDGDAIGSLDAEQEAGSAGERSVALTGLFGGGGERPDDGGMNLLEIDEREFLGAESSLEFLAVFEDVLAGVPVGEAEIENFLSVEIGDATGDGAETVEEPRNFFEGVEFENF